MTWTDEVLGRDRGERRAGELLEILELDGAERTLVMEYSTGMRKKIGLATVLPHAPRLLVLDEPLEAVRPDRSLGGVTQSRHRVRVIALL